MNGLNMITVLLAGVFTAAGLIGLGAPALARRLLLGFPRSRTMRWVLTAIVLGWCGHLLYHGPLGFLEPYRVWLLLLVPLAVVLLCCYVDELLAARALGGLLILVPAPMLDAARWEPSLWRYAPILLAYVMVVVGAWLVAAPYVFRKAVERLAPSEAACRRAAMASLVLGVGMGALGLFVV